MEAERGSARLRRSRLTSKKELYVEILSFFASRLIRGSKFSTSSIMSQSPLGISITVILGNTVLITKDGFRVQFNN